jgi:hypothetical protein
MSTQDRDKWINIRLEEAHQAAVGGAKQTFDHRKPEGARQSTTAKRAFDPSHRMRKGK